MLHINYTNSDSGATAAIAKIATANYNFTDASKSVSFGVDLFLDLTRAKNGASPVESNNYSFEDISGVDVSLLTQPGDNAITLFHKFLIGSGLFPGATLVTQAEIDAA